MVHSLLYISAFEAALLLFCLEALVKQSAYVKDMEIILFATCLRDP